MLLRLLFKDKEKKKRLAHIGAGIVILIHAYEKYENGHNSYKLFISAGLIFLLIALLHPVIERMAPWIDGIFLIIEGVLSIIIAFDYFHMGKTAIPICYLCVSVFQFIMAFRRSKQGIAKHRPDQ